MHNYIITFFILITILAIINVCLKKIKILVHSNLNDTHKKFGSNQVPLSGGLFFFGILYFLYHDQNIVDNFLLIVVISFLILGLIVDFNIDINPKLRFFFQILITITLVIAGNIFIDKTNLPFLDFFLNFEIFNIFFSCFCILVLLNGLNFIDGVNNNVIGFLLLIISSIIIIETKNNSFEDLEIYNFFFISLVVFYIFNSFNKSYLGDSGIYILSIYFSVLIIYYVNNSEYVSPILAVNLLWYPALETLFSIIRKLIYKKNPFKPDTFHLHTLILKSFIFYKLKHANTLTGITINIILIPNFFVAINYYSHTIIMVSTSIIYVLLYLLLYYKLSSFLNNER